jgi:hypothetical protein
MISDKRFNPIKRRVFTNHPHTPINVKKDLNDTRRFVSHEKWTKEEVI